MGQPMRVWEGEDCSFPKPGELIEIRDHSSMTMQDRRVLNMLLTNAWPRITEQIEHSIPKSLLRGEHNSNDQLGDTIDRLMKTIVVLKVVRNGRTSDLKVQLLGPTVENRDDSGNLYYRFLPEMIEIIAQSDHWARLQAQVMLALTSKYAIALYEMIEKRAGLKSKFCEEFTVEEIRDVLGVPDGRMTKWANLYRFALEPAARQVREMSNCVVSIDPIRAGRQVPRVRLAWFRKDEEGLKLTYQAVEKNKTERRNRRTGKGSRAQQELAL